MTTRRKKYRKRTKTHKFRNCNRPPTRPCKDNVDALTGEQILDLGESFGTWKTDMEMGERSIQATSRLLNQQMQKLQSLMFKGRQPAYQTGIQKEINDKEKQRVRYYIEQLRQNIEATKNKVTRMRNTLSVPDVEEVYSKAIREGNLNNFVQFSPGNDCTSIKNFINYKKSLESQGKPLVHPITKRPIWCYNGILYIDFVIDKYKKITDYLVNNRYVDSANRHDQKLLLRIIHSDNFKSTHQNYRDFRSIIATTVYIQSFVQEKQRIEGVQNFEDLSNNSISEILNLNPKELYQYTQQRLKTAFERDVREGIKPAVDIVQDYKQQQIKIIDIIKKSTNLFENDRIVQKSYESGAPCQFPNPEDGVFFDSTYLQYCQDKDSFAKEKLGLRGARLQNINLSSYNFYKTNLESADLSNSNLSGVDLRKANLKNTILDNTDLSDANLVGVYSGGIKFNNPPKLDYGYKIDQGFIFGRGVNIIDYNPVYNDKRPANFNNPLDLSNYNLEFSDFSACQFNAVNFTNCRLNNCNFTYIDAGVQQFPDGTVRQQYIPTIFGPSIFRNAYIQDSIFLNSDMSAVTDMTGIRGKIANTVDPISRTVVRGYPKSLPPGYICKYGYFFGPGINFETEELESDTSVGDPSIQDLSKINLSHSNFRNSNIEDTTFSNTLFINSDLSGAVIDNCYFSDSNFTNVTFMKTDIETDYHNVNDVDFSGVIFDNCNILHISFYECDFNDANLINISPFDLSQAAPYERNKPQIIFDNCTFERTKFLNSHFTNVEFNNSNFENSDFSYSILVDVIFYKCILNKSNFEGCNMKGVIFRECEMHGVANFPNNFTSKDGFRFKIE